MITRNIHQICNTQRIRNKRQTGSFFDEPVEVVLTSFGDFRFDAVSSWAEIELFAAAVGIDFDINFINVLCMTSYFFDNIRTALVAELSVPGSSLDGVANSTAFVECVFKTFTFVAGVNVRPQFYVLDWIYKNGIQVEYVARSESDETKAKFELLDALDRKFPYLLVKFYAAHSADLRRNDMRFVTWLMRRIETRSASDRRLAGVLGALRKDASEIDRIAMYMS